MRFKYNFIYDDFYISTNVNLRTKHCLKGVRIWSYSVRTRKVRTRITPNMDTFHALKMNVDFEMFAARNGKKFKEMSINRIRKD